MKNTYPLVCILMLQCVAACNTGSLYATVHPTDISKTPVTPGGTTGNTNDTNTMAPPDLSQTPLQAPTFQPTIDGNVFTPQAVFYATGQDPQGHLVMMLVVSDQKDLCTQVTQAHALTPGGSQLVLYLYEIRTAAGMSTFVAPLTNNSTFAVFEAVAANGDISANPSENIPIDTGGYAGGMFFTWGPTCAKAPIHQLTEGAVTLSEVDTAHDKASGDMQVLLDDSVLLDKGGSFVAQACPALLQVPTTLTACTLP